MDTVQKQEFLLRDLPTRTVTLFPSRAQVVRDIKNVTLKPGINQISIVGLTPTVDQHSIKIEGAGSAVITDFSVQLLPNRDIFEETFPDSEGDNKNWKTTLGKQWDQVEVAVPDTPSILKLLAELVEVQNKISAKEHDLKRAAEVTANAGSRLKMLDDYGARFEPQSGKDIAEMIGAYHTQRDIIFQDHMAGSLRETELRKELGGLRARFSTLDNQIREERSKASRHIRKERDENIKQAALDKKRQAKENQERLRIRLEQEKFWPKSCYTVCITLDNTEYTPISSRRSSISSVTELMKPVVEKVYETATPDVDLPGSVCDLSISYVTSSASWSPCYDIQLDTRSNTAALFFDAQLSNATSESWKDCKITLSTSQAVFTGLHDTIPKLVPWRIRLATQGANNAGDISNSLEERARFHKNALNGAGNDIGGRSDLFGRSSGDPMQDGSLARCRRRTAGPGDGDGGRYSHVQHRFHSEPGYGSAFGISNEAHQLSSSGDFITPYENMMEPEIPQIDFQESAMEETGLTTTYDLPGVRSLVPNFTPSKQRVARISFTGVEFSHIVVAKYRPAAFLKAKLRNASKLSLLKGPAGLTLDGSFLGRSVLPRCSSGDSFSLSLGIDPAIRVLYPKPEVKRSSSGVFNKENSTSYTRTITLINTSGGKSVRLAVMDQVPAAEDEKLKVELVHPRGLVVGGAEIPTGAQDGNSREGRDWGKAVASMKKAGQIMWNVSLRAGKGAKLTLEYEVSLPAGERAVQVPQGDTGSWW